jgi:hydroxypyruvate isomerase
MKFSANLGFLFPEATTLIEQYQLAKSAGFKAVEHPFPASNIDHDELLKVKQGSNLKLALVNIQLNPDAKFGCAAIPEKINEFQQNLQSTLTFAKAFDCKKIHLMSGKMENPPTSANHETFLSNLKYAAVLLEKAGIVGVIEPINHYSVPGYYLNDFNYAIDTIKAIGSNNLKLMVDIFHLQMIRGNVTNALKDFAPFIGHIQIAQAPGRNEPDTEGELNYRYILSQIEGTGYDDFVGLEYKPSTTTVDGLKWIRDFNYEL